jgi:DNA-binding CsgD family transcriptional regulator
MRGMQCDRRSIIQGERRGDNVQNSHAGFSRAEGNYLSRVTILVLGTGPFWTQQTCGHIEAEFDSACLRVDSIDTAADLAPGLSGLRLLIVDEQQAGDLLDRTELYFGVSPSASVALAYRDVDVARDVDRRYDGNFGPMGYLPMRVPFDVWLSSIRLLLHGEHFLPRDLRPVPEADNQPPDVGAVPVATDMQGGRLRGLTDRENEVLCLASAGHSNKMISRKLAISEHTVKLHMHHVYEKLGVSNRTAAASLLHGAERVS